LPLPSSAPIPSLLPLPTASAHPLSTIPVVIRSAAPIPPPIPLPLSTLLPLPPPILGRYSSSSRASPRRYRAPAPRSAARPPVLRRPHVLSDRHPQPMQHVNRVCSVSSSATRQRMSPFQ